MVYQITEIAEADFGCEERMPGEKAKVLLYLRDENNQETRREVEEDWLNELGLCEGSKLYEFYGWEHAEVPPVAEAYTKIQDPKHLYDLLSEIWCADTCAPRMRHNWTKENQTLGQCSITAFLAQDIFGGDVYGILRPGGNYHCYNVIGNCVFDLTSEQFGEEKLNYENNPIQTRETHFSKEEKRLRYEYLKHTLLDRLQ